MSSLDPSASGELAPERQCLDAGRCTHECGNAPCFRLSCCGPLSGVFPDNRWPELGMTCEWPARRWENIACGRKANHLAVAPGLRWWRSTCGIHARRARTLEWLVSKVKPDIDRGTDG